MHAKLRAALSRRHVIGSAVAVVAGAALAVAVAGPAAAGSEIRTAEVIDLEIDGRDDAPLGVDDIAPRLSWRVTGARPGWLQSAYQIRAARTIREVATGPYLWASGKISSSAQSDIPWGGVELPSRQAVAWQVRVWSTQGDVTPWSKPATWEMGLLTRGDWGAARWIEYPGRGVGAPLPIFARAFTVADANHSPLLKARLYLSAVGLFHAELNGEAVSDEVLAPGNSNYQLSVEYRTYDVTRLIHPGAN